MTTTYEPVPAQFYVRLNGKMQGTIKETPEGWRYSVKRSKVWSAAYENLDSLKADIEADTVTAAVSEEA